MKKVFIIWSNFNQFGFGIEVEEKDYPKAKRLALEGWEKWNNPDCSEYYEKGFTEPSTELLDKAGIKYRLLSDEEITDPDNPDCFNMELDPEILDD